MSDYLSDANFPHYRLGCKRDIVSASDYFSDADYLTIDWATSIACSQTYSIS